MHKGVNGILWGVDFVLRHLLVPLDGSRLAEAILPATRHLARRLQADVTLLHVIEEKTPSRVHGEMHLARPGEAQTYLERIQQGLRQQGIDVRSHVHEAAEGDVARSIVRHAEEFGNDLIMLSTHGSSGVRNLLIGSIAQQVLGTGTTPVFVIHPEAGASARAGVEAGAGGEARAAGTGPGVRPFRCQRLAIPLDMKPHHEESLPLACELAAACHASLSLVTVVPRRNDLSGSEGASGRLLPLTARAALEVREREACEYLQQVAARLQMTCLQQANSQQTSNREFVPPATSWRVIRGEPASALVFFFADARIDLVVIASHALPAWQAFWEGSVTPRLLTQWRRPVLLVKARN